MYQCELCGAEFDEFAAVRKPEYHSQVDSHEMCLYYVCPICGAGEQYSKVVDDDRK